MYDFPWTAPALDAVWAGLSSRLRQAGLDAPHALTRGAPIDDVWRDPGLMLGQTCGYPYWRGLSDIVVLIATPIYAFEGCEGPLHRSFLVARRGYARGALADFRGARAAINARDSNSGMNLFRAAIAPLAQGRPFFQEVVVTGAHAASMAAVAEGRADIAAIDCVSFALLRRGRPELVDRVEVVAQSPLSPGLPLIASATLPVASTAAIRRAITDALEDVGLAEPLAALGWGGVGFLGREDYARIGELEQAARELGYPELA